MKFLDWDLKLGFRSLYMPITTVNGMQYLSAVYKRTIVNIEI